MGVNSLPKTVTRQRFEPAGPSAPQSSTLTNRLPSHPQPHTIEYYNSVAASNARRTSSRAVGRKRRTGASDVPVSEMNLLVLALVSCES